MYLLFDIGCIECGEESQPVGIYETQEEAEQSKKAYLTGGKWGRPDWYGQHSVELFNLPSFGIKNTHKST